MLFLFLFRTYINLVAVNRSKTLPALQFMQKVYCSELPMNEDRGIKLFTGAKFTSLPLIV